MKTAQRCKSSAELPFLELSKQDETKKQRKNTKNKQKRDTQTLEGPCPGVIGPLVEGPCPGVIGPSEEGPCPGVIGPLGEGPCPGVIGPSEEGPCPGVIGPLVEGPCPGVIGPSVEGPCPGVIGPLVEGPCPGVIGQLVEGPCPGVIRPLEEGPCPGGTAVDVLLSSLPVSVAALPAGLTLARRFGPLGHWVHWFRLRQRSSRISTEPENLPVTDSGFIATQT